MPKPEIWSDAALNDLIEIGQFTLDLWGEKIVDRFERDVKRSIAAIQQFPFGWPESAEIKGARKCVVNPHVSLYYEWIGDQLYILRLYANRKDPRGLSGR